MAREIAITEHDDGSATIQFKPDFIEYNFDSCNDALAALSMLPETETK
ncbi:MULTISPECIES: hypothetical protein [Shewanella]|nr:MULTISPECIES: hypothetical protein [Shewanella]